MYAIYIVLSASLFLILGQVGSSVALKHDHKLTNGFPSFSLSKAPSIEGKKESERVRLDT